MQVRRVFSKHLVRLAKGERRSGEWECQGAWYPEGITGEENEQPEWSGLGAGHCFVFGLGNFSAIGTHRETLPAAYLSSGDNQPRFFSYSPPSLSLKWKSVYPDTVTGFLFLFCFLHKDLELKISAPAAESSEGIFQSKWTHAFAFSRTRFLPLATHREPVCAGPCSAVFSSGSSALWDRTELFSIPSQSKTSKLWKITKHKIKLTSKSPMKLTLTSHPGSALWLMWIALCNLRFAIRAVGKEMVCTLGPSALCTALRSHS